MARPLHISKAEIKKQAELIFRPAKFGESGIGVCYPGCKIDYLLQCLLARPKIIRSILGKYYRRFIFAAFYLEKIGPFADFLAELKIVVGREGIDVSEEDLFPAVCHKVVNAGRELHLFLMNAHEVDVEKLKEPLQAVNKQALSAERVGAVVFLEANINRQDLRAIFRKNHKFLQNIFYFPVYTYDESIKFLQALAKQWKLKVEQKQLAELAKGCGGYLWMLREALRNVRDSQLTEIDEIAKQSGIQFRLNTIYNLFTEEEKEALSQLCFGDAEEVDSLHRDYFVSLGVVEKQRQGYRLTMPLLEPLVKRTSAAMRLNIVGDSAIELDGKDVTAKFTEFELQILLLLHAKKGKIVSREDIAHKIWGKEWTDRYSDWALDKLISRLRSAVASLGLSKEIIVTKKGRGFMLV